MTLDLPGEVHVAPTLHEVYDLFAASLLDAALTSVKDRGVFHCAFSGGRSPEGLFVHLVIDPRYRAIPWDLAHVWLVDERLTPLDDEQSNFRMIRETLLDHLPMKSRQIHPVPVDAADPAKEYEKELAAGLGASNRLDFVQLGMGRDGHTASLFPGSDALTVDDRTIVENRGPKVTPPPRVTMTLPLLNSARELAVLVTGAGKAGALRDVSARWREAGPDPDRYPITGLAPTDGRLRWYLDADAAGEPRVESIELA